MSSLPRQIVPAAVLVGVTLLIGGCGGSSSPGVAHLSQAKSTSDTSPEDSGSSQSTASTQQTLITYARCMRSGGVPDYPEPVGDHIIMKVDGPKGSGDRLRESAPFKAAEKQCRKLLPNGGEPSPQVHKQIEESALKLSACMRSHGVPNFPTPRVEGGLVHLGIHPGSALDTGSPQFGAAMKTCRGYFGPGSKGAAAAASPSGVAVAP